MNQQTLLIICIFGCLLFVFSFTLFFLIRKMLQMMTKIEHLNYNVHMLKEELKENSLDITEGVETLQTSVTKALDYVMKTSNEEVYPMPQVANMISETIAEQIHLHTVMNQNRNIIPKQDFEKIVIAVCKTYPNVSKEYIAMKAMAMVESLRDGK